MVWGLSTAHRQAVPQLADDHLAQTHTGTEFVMQQLQHHETPCNSCNTMKHLATYATACNTMCHSATACNTRQHNGIATTCNECNNMRHIQERSLSPRTASVQEGQRRSLQEGQRRALKGRERQLQGSARGQGTAAVEEFATSHSAESRGQRSRRPATGAARPVSGW